MATKDTQKNTVVEKTSKKAPTSMKTEVYSQKGKSVGSYDLPESIFGLPWNDDLGHQVVTAMQANSRKPVPHSRTRGEVHGGGETH